MGLLLHEAIIVSLIQPLIWTYFLALLPLQGSAPLRILCGSVPVKRRSIRTLRGEIGAQKGLCPATFRIPFLWEGLSV